MKSKLTIDFRGIDVMPSGQQFEPVIRAIVEDSEDVRDSLMKSFFQQLNGESNWLNVDIWSTGIDNKQVITITPISPSFILDNAEIMLSRIPQEDRVHWLNEQLNKNLKGIDKEL